MRLVVITLESDLREVGSFELNKYTFYATRPAEMLYMHFASVNIKEQLSFMNELTSSCELKSEQELPNITSCFDNVTRTPFPEAISFWLDHLLYTSPLDDDQFLPTNLLGDIQARDLLKSEAEGIRNYDPNMIVEIDEIKPEGASAVFDEKVAAYFKIPQYSQIEQETIGESDKISVTQIMKALEIKNQKEPVPARADQQKDRAKVLKNYLTCLKRNVLILKKRELEKIDDQTINCFLKSQHKTNKREFESLFLNEKARAILASLFNSTALYRQLQVSVMSSQNRKFYLNELALMKKALIEGRLPNL